MRPVTQFKHDPIAIEAEAASLRVWAVEIVLWLTDALAALGIPALRKRAAAALSVHAPRLRADLRGAAYDLRRILFFKAFARLRLYPPATPHRSLRAGKRRGARSEMRALIGGALPDLNRGSLRQRARRLARILDNPEPFIARIAARLMRVCGRLRGARPGCARAPDQRIAAAAPPAPQSADTS